MGLKFEEVASLKKGDVIWENHQYGSIQVELLEDPVVIDCVGEHSKEGEKRVEFPAKIVNSESGRVINYLLNNFHMHYGPRLDRKNNYITRAELDAIPEKNNESK